MPWLLALLLALDPATVWSNRCFSCCDTAPVLGAAGRPLAARAPSNGQRSAGPAGPRPFDGSAKPPPPGTTSAGSAGSAASPSSPPATLASTAHAAAHALASASRALVAPRRSSRAA